MPVWCVTGNLGGGKTLMCVSKIQEYLNKNRRVVTNLDLNVENLVSPFAKKTNVIRIPDIPDIDDFKAIGRGYEGEIKGDDHNGLIVLDECALWLNARAWSDKNRKAINDYFVHLRKLRWDLMLIIQHKDSLDKQFRENYCEHFVYCSRTDRLKIPFVGWLLNFVCAGRVRLPRVHVGEVYYTRGGKEERVDTWFARGNHLFSAYDTEQGFNTSTSPAIYSYLPPNTIKGRYIDKKQVIKDKLKNIGLLPFFLVGLLSGGFVVHANTPDGNEPDRGHWNCNADWEKLFGDCELSKAQVREAIKVYKNHSLSKDSEAVGSDLSLTAADDSLDKDKLHNVYISGSVINGSDIEYIFNDDVGTWYPYENGYRVYDHDECQATLLNMDNPKDRRIIRCRQ